MAIMSFNSLFSSLQTIFHAPFTLNGAANDAQKPVYRMGQTYQVATVFDRYTHQKELSAIIAQKFKSKTFKKLVLCSGDIGTNMAPIGGVHLLRLMHPDYAAPAIANHIIYDPKSIHTGTDCTETRRLVGHLIGPNAVGQKDILAFASPWHAMRCYLTAIKQTPDLNMQFSLSSYNRANMYDGSWQKNSEYLSWMWSELARLKPSPHIADIGTIVPGCTTAQIETTQILLEQYLRNTYALDPRTVARGVPSAPSITDASQIITEPDSPQLTYPRELEKIGLVKETLAQFELTKMLMTGVYLHNKTRQPLNPHTIKRLKPYSDYLVEAIEDNKQQTQLKIV